MQYEINGGLKHIEEDVYSEGCRMGTSSCWDIDVRLRADSVDELIKKLNEFLGNDDPGAMELDACDEPGRIDVQMLEDDKGMQADARQIEAWKKGKLRLWLADYSFRVEAIERLSVMLAR